MTKSAEEVFEEYRGKMEATVLIKPTDRDYYAIVAGAMSIEIAELRERVHDGNGAQKDRVEEAREPDRLLHTVGGVRAGHTGA